MNHYTLNWVIALIFVLGCSNPVADENSEISKSSAQMISNIQFTDDTMIVDVHSSTPNPCYDPMPPKIQQSGNIFYVELNVKRLDVVCITILGLIKHSVELPVEKGSNYTVEFFRFNELPLDTTITVPVN